MKRTASSILAVVLAFTMSTPGLAQESREPQPAAPGPKLVVRIDITPAQQRASLAFWTREQTAAAKPMEMLLETGTPAMDMTAQSQAEVAGPSGSVAAGLPA